MSAKEELLHKLAEEERELLVRIDRLGNFTKTHQFADLMPRARRLLRCQEGIMESYASILRARIEDIKEQP